MGPWVGVLRQAAWRARVGGTPLVLDLTAVTQVSHEGAEVLCALQGDGADLVGCSPLVERMCGAHKGTAP